MNLLLKEYLSSGDCREVMRWCVASGPRHISLSPLPPSLSLSLFKADRCLHELEVPHFHHELVYEVSTSVPCMYIVCMYCVQVLY